MNQSVQISTRRPTTTAEINELIVESIRDTKGKNIVKLDLRHLDDAPTDFFIICEGDSNTQVKAISDNISKRLKQVGDLLPSHVEGTRSALWICLDYFTTVVHVFHKEKRSFYELEDLWGDASITEYQDL